MKIIIGVEENNDKVLVCTECRTVFSYSKEDINKDNTICCPICDEIFNIEEYGK